MRHLHGNERHGLLCVFVLTDLPMVPLASITMILAIGLPPYCHQANSRPKYSPPELTCMVLIDQWPCPDSTRLFQSLDLLQMFDLFCAHLKLAISGQSFAILNEALGNFYNYRRANCLSAKTPPTNYSEARPITGVVCCLPWGCGLGKSSVIVNWSISLPSIVSIGACIRRGCDRYGHTG